MTIAISVSTPQIINGLKHIPYFRKVRQQLHQHMLKICSP